MAASLPEIHPVRLERLNQRQKNKGRCLARHENDFEAAAETTVDIDELLGALRGASGAKAGSRAKAIANCLSAGEGWRDSAAELGGAFAALARPTGLTGGKDK